MKAYYIIHAKHVTCQPESDVILAYLLISNSLATLINSSALGQLKYFQNLQLYTGVVRFIAYPTVNHTNSFCFWILELHQFTGHFQDY